MTSTATTTQTTKCPQWCSHHRDDGEGSIVHRASVTEGEATVELQVGPENDGLPILLPEVIECGASAARDLSHALRLAAWVVEGPPGRVPARRPQVGRAGEIGTAARIGDI